MAASVQEQLRAAFKVARDNEYACTDRVLDPPGIAMATLTEAMETLKALPDPESGWLFAQGFWPQIVHDYEDQIENYKEMLRRIASGEEPASALMKKRPPSAVAIDRMQAVFDVYPRCLVGTDRARDWKILCALASGQSYRVVAKLVKCAHSRIGDRRELQLAAIARKLAELMPEPIAEGAPAHPVYHLDRPA